MNRYVLPPLTGVLAILLVAGCGGSPTQGTPVPAPSTESTLSPLPPRPADLPVDGLDACSLLTPQQRTQLKIDSTTAGDRNDCGFRVGSLKRDYVWILALVRPSTVARAARGEGATVTQIDGFPAVRTASSVFDRDYHCILVIDIAPDQDLSVYYQSTHKDIPGMNYERACQQAAVVAEMALGNLRSQAR